MSKEQTIAKGEIVKEQTPIAALTAAVTAAPPAATPAPPSAASIATAPTSALPEYRPDPLLAKILGTRRAHTSTGDNNFRLWLAAQIRAMGYTPEILVEGNIYVTTEPKATTLFSCHVDTCHSMSESNSANVQPLAFDPVMGHVYLSDKDNCGCLGADDGAGVYVMLKMLEAKVRGHYVFHTGEERGGVGSRALIAKRDQYKKWFDLLETVVAFDRGVHQGTNPEIIHTQGGTRCASDEYASALAKALNATEFDLPYVISGKGSFTDSKLYAPYVAECVNVGVFYAQQHGPTEYLDVYSLDKLVEAVKTVPWESLPIKREPKEEVYRPPFQGGRTADMYSDDNYGYGTYGYESAGSGKKPVTVQQIKPQQQKKPTFAPAPAPADKLALLQEMEDFTMDDFENLIYSESEIAIYAMASLFARYKGLKAEVEVYRNLLDM